MTAAIALSGCADFREKLERGDIEQAQQLDNPVAISRALPAVISRLDHIPIGVDDLDAAAGRFRGLGFTLKEGRAHANGIRNLHAKFADGTELELITASAARDELTAAYRRHLERGDGPAYLAFSVPELEAARARLGEFADRAEGGPIISFPPDDPLAPYFFGEPLTSATDRPEHFVHANGAQGLVRVWIAPDDPAEVERILSAMGLQFEAGERCLPECHPVRIGTIATYELVIFAADRQYTDHRPILGATLRTSSLAMLRETLIANGIDQSRALLSEDGRSLFVPPDLANGLWLEFREPG